MENNNYIINENGESQIENTDKFNLNAITSDLKATFKSNKSKDINFRIKQLKALDRLLSENKNELISAIRLDLGKDDYEASVIDYYHVVHEVRYAIKNVKSWCNSKSVRSPLFLFPTKCQFRYDPLGVVLIISPWNYPIKLVIDPLVGAIAGGNCVFIKTSPFSLNTSSLLCSLLNKYLDNDCYKCEFEGEAEYITEIIKYKWDYIFFTGSSKVGKIVYEAAAKHLTPVTLELGGKNPAIVDKDVNFQIVTKRILVLKYLSAGQTCTTTDIVYVHKDNLNEFIEQCKLGLQDFYGNDVKSNEQYCRIISKKHTERLQSLFQYGQVVVGGESDIENKYISPTIIINPQFNTPLMNDEIFGPIMIVLTYETFDEIIEYYNNQPSPLALYIFSKSKKTQKLLMDSIPSGGVSINDSYTIPVNPKLTFGGVGESGFGSYNGKKTFKLFTHKKSVQYTPYSSIFNFFVKLRQPPYTKFKKFISYLGLEIGI